MDYEAYKKQVNETNPFMRHNQMEAVSVSAEQAVVRAHITAELKNSMGGVHAGLLFSMGEITAGLLARGDGSKQVTLDSSFRFLRNSMNAEYLEAEAKFIKRGRTITMCRTVIYEPEHRTVLAEGEFSFYCLNQ